MHRRGRVRRGAAGEIRTGAADEAGETGNLPPKTLRPSGAPVVSLGMNDLDLSEKPNLNTGKPWGSGQDRDIRWGLDHNDPIEEIADFLCRTPSEVSRRIREIAEADAIGDPSLLSDGVIDRD